MALPKQVQRQLDAAESILAPVPAEVVPAPAVVPEPVAEAPGSEVVPQPAVVENPAPTPAPAPQAPTENWEHKYKTLQGIHNSHVGDLKQRVIALEQEKANLLQRVETQPPAQVAALDPKDVDVFGSDLVDMVKRVAEATMGTAARSIDGRLTAIEQRLDGTQAAVSRTSEDLFLETLTKLVPDWETINTDEGFLAWLGGVDPVYGVPRQNALTAAGDAKDATRVARIFKAYAATLTPASPTPARPTPASQLEKQVAPRASGGGAPPVNPAPKTFTVAEVQAFYRDVQQGKYRGREPDAMALEAVYNAALAEGRIVERAPRQSM